MTTHMADFNKKQFMQRAGALTLSGLMTLGMAGVPVFAAPGDVQYPVDASHPVPQGEYQTTHTDSFTANVADATETTAEIDANKSVTVDIWKYDMTGAKREGVLSEDNKSIKTADGTVIDIYDDDGDQYAKSMEDDAQIRSALAEYAIEGVQFTYRQIGEPVQIKYTDANGVHHVKVVYKMRQAAQSNGLFKALGITTADYVNESDLDADSKNSSGYIYLTSDTLVNKLRAALQDDPTGVKNALEDYMYRNASDGSYYAGPYTTALTDTNGHTRFSINGEDQGIYLVVESQVPESVTVTVDPFILALPSTTLNGDAWSYNVTVYPKNITGHPIMEKFVRESMYDSGTHTTTGTLAGGNSKVEAAVKAEGYSHNTTASMGDVVEYKIVTRIPTITSDATDLTNLSINDMLDPGLSYENLNNDKTYDAAKYNARVDGNYKYEVAPAEIKIYKDASLSQEIVTLERGKDFTVTTGTASFQTKADVVGQSTTCETMKMNLTAAGLRKINDGTEMGWDAKSEEKGLSRAYMVMTYSARLKSDTTVIIGEKSNKNTCELQWHRTADGTDPNGPLDDQTTSGGTVSEDYHGYYDTIKDDTHVYTYGLDLTINYSEQVGTESDNTDNTFIMRNVTANNGYANTAKTLENLGGDGTAADDNASRTENGYYIIAEYNEHDGIWYVTGHTDDESEATEMHANSRSLVTDADDGPAGGKYAGDYAGDLVIMGLEADDYELSMVKTSNGYTLLKDDIDIHIETAETDYYCAQHSETDPDTYTPAEQSDPRIPVSAEVNDGDVNDGYWPDDAQPDYQDDKGFQSDSSGTIQPNPGSFPENSQSADGDDRDADPNKDQDPGDLGNNPDGINTEMNAIQTEIHKKLTASATVDGDPVTLTDDPTPNPTPDDPDPEPNDPDPSPKGIVPIEVTITKGFSLPITGGYGTWLASFAGVAAVAGGMLSLKKRKKEDQVDAA